MNVELYSLQLSAPKKMPEALYFRTEGTVIHTNAGLKMSCGSAISFDTWFGCFDYQQWRNHTILTTPVASFLLNGTMRVQCWIRTTETISLLYEQIVTGDGIHPQAFPFFISNLPEDGFLYFRFQAESEDCHFLSGQYLADVPEQTSIQIAAVICTYQREGWVHQTFQQLLQWQKEHTKLPITIFLIDNGNTWTSDQLPESEQFILVSNPNTGGSGGFTRGIQEALRETTNTHILLMDDDILADWNGVARMIAFLSLCKPEQRNTLTIGGTMLDFLHPELQFEAGAFCQNRCLTGIQPKADLTDVAVLQKRIGALPSSDYAAWWMCCMPVPAVRRTGLPMPFFIKMDDVEYALRMQQQVVMLTGSCVWHENFNVKYAPWNEYYITRNGCITYALHGQAANRISVIKELWKSVLRLLLLYRYDTATFVLQGYRDFLRGWNWLTQIDASNLHQQILQQQHTATEQFSIPEEEAPQNLRKVSIFSASIRDFKKQNAVFFVHPILKKGFLAKKERKRTYRLLFRMLSISGRMLCTYSQTVRGYQKHLEELCEEVAWNQKNHRTVVDKPPIL